MRADIPETRAFLEAAGFHTVPNSTAARVHATRTRNGNARELIVWTPPARGGERERSQQLESVLPEMKAAAASNPGALRIVLLPTWGPPQNTAATAAGGLVRAPIQFFDAPFRQNPDIDFGIGTGEQEATDLARTLIKPERLDREHLQAVLRPQMAAYLDRPPERVPQPYFIRMGLQPSGKPRPDGQDLLQHLIARLERHPASPEIFMIVGPAGSGKTYLLEALFTYAYEGFMQAKGKQQMGVRPIPILPASLLRADSYSTEKLFAAVAQTECAGALGPELLDFCVGNGQTILMIDGLDEFFAEQADFFSEIKRRYLSDSSIARVIIVLRDSLLATSPNVRKLVEELGALSQSGTAAFAMYELGLWDTNASKRTMAWLRIARRRPDPHETDPPPVKTFLDQLQASPIMDDLARLPYYCERLIERYNEKPDSWLPADEYDLLEYMLDKLIKREWDKHKPGPDDRPQPQGVFITGPELIRILLRRQGTNQEIASKGEEAFRSILEEAAYYHRRIPGWAAEGSGAAGSSLYQVLSDLQNEGHQWTWAIMGHVERWFNNAARERGQRILRQFALFVQGDGGTEFAHEIMADYLAARYALKRIRDNPRMFSDIVGTPGAPETPIFAGFLRRELTRDQELADAVRRLLPPPSDRASAYVRAIVG